MGLLTNEQVDPVRQEADSTGEGIVDTLIAKNVIRPADVAQARAAHANVEFVKLSELRIGDEVIKAVPRHIAKRYNVIPILKDENGIKVAIADPSDLDTIDSLTHSLGLPVEMAVASPDDIESALGRYYGAKDDSVSKMIEDITEGEVEVGKVGTLGGPGNDEAVVAADAPIIKLVNTIIVEAFKSRASDIHLDRKSTRLN